MPYFLKLFIGYFLTFIIFGLINKEFNIREKLRKKFYPSPKKRYFLKYSLMFVTYVMLLTLVATIANLPVNYLYVFSGAIIGSGFYIIPYPNAHLITKPAPKKPHKNKLKKGKK